MSYLCELFFIVIFIFIITREQVYFLVYGPTDPILSNNKKILQNFGQMSFCNLLFSAFWKKKKKRNKT